MQQDQAPNEPQFSGGNVHCVYLSGAGVLYTSGDSEHVDGILGNGQNPPPRRTRAGTAYQAVPQTTSLPAVVASTCPSAASPLLFLAASASISHNVAVSTAKQVYTWGDRARALGHGEVGSLDSVSYTPKLVEALAGEKIVSAVAGRGATFAVSEEGKLYAWGCGYMGCLGVRCKTDRWGDPDWPEHSMPVVVVELAGKVVKAVAGGFNSTLVLTGDGEVYSMGQGQRGQLGHEGFPHHELLPRLIDSLRGKRVVHVSAGWDRSYASTDAGEFFSWGCGREAALGHPGKENEAVPRRVDALSGAHTVKSAVGENHVIVLALSGKVYTAGEGPGGVLGRGGRPGTPGLVRGELEDVKVVAIGAGDSCCLAAAADGKTYGWGWGVLFGKGEVSINEPVELVQL